jgi:surface-adhesin protein E
MRTVQLQSLGLIVLAHIGTVALGQPPDSLTLVSAGAFYSLRMADLEVTNEVRIAGWDVSYEWEHHLRSNESYQFAVLRVAYDCIKQRYALLSEELYADRFLSTSLKSTIGDIGRLSWREAKPNSIEERQLRAVCSIQ